MEDGWRRSFNYDEAKQFYEAGASVNEIAQYYGVSRAAIYDAFEQIAFTPNARRRSNPSRPGKRKLDYAAAKQLYEAGWSTREIGAELGVSHDTVRLAIKQLGVQLRPRQVRTRSFDWEAAKKLYESGVSQADIAERFGVSDQAIRHALRELGVPPIPPSSRRLFDYQEAKRLYESGLNQTQVAKRLGVDQTSVGEALRSLNVPANRYKGGPPRTFDHERVKVLYDLGFSRRDIARKLGITYESVCRVLRIRRTS